MAWWRAYRGDSFVASGECVMSDMVESVVMVYVCIIVSVDGYEIVFCKNSIKGKLICINLTQTNDYTF